MQCVSLHDYLNDPAGQPCHLVLNADFSFDSRCFLLRLHWRRRRSAHTPSGALRLDARGNVRNWWRWRRWYRSCCSFVLRESCFFHRKTHLSEVFNTETCFHGIEKKKVNCDNSVRLFLEDIKVNISKWALLRNIIWAYYEKLQTEKNNVKLTSRKKCLKL